jgi:glycosyltransferase involved in cell wall biosynthesis
LVNRNILMLITELTLGGAEKVFYDHVLELSKVHNVLVCVFTKKGHNDIFKIPNPIFELDTKPIKNPLTRWLHRKKRLQEIILANNIDVCISHMEGPNFLNTWANHKCKKILCVHGSIQKNSQKGFLQKNIINKVLIPLLYNKADVIVTVSKGIGEEHLRAGVKKSKLVVINNFFDIELIKSKAKENSDFSDEFFTANKVLIHVGRLAPEKNQQFLIRLIKILKAKDRTYKLLLIGNGPLYQDLVDIAVSEDLKIYDSKCNDEVNEEADVFFMGAQANPFKYIIRSRLFLLSSFNEGFPLVLGESLACGIPVVAVDCPTGPREILSKDGELEVQYNSYEKMYCGLLMKYFEDLHSFDKELDIWAKAITELLHDEEALNQLRKNAAIRAEFYASRNIIPQWLNLIN